MWGTNETDDEKRELLSLGRLVVSISGASSAKIQKRYHRPRSSLA